MNRREMMKAMGAISALGASPRIAWAQEREDPRFLIVLGATGGASIIDGAMALSAEEVTGNPGTLNCFAEANVRTFPGSELRAVDLTRSSLGSINAGFSSDQSSFVQKHLQDMMVATVEGTSVNHGIAQRRAVTGNEAWSGRTLQELVALQHGEGYPLPNVHLATGTGFTERGTDDGLPGWCYGEPVSDPSVFALALHGSKGVNTAPPPGVVAKARAIRNEVLDPASHFRRVFNGSAALAEWEHRRRVEAIEQADLVGKLLLRGGGGLSPSPDLASIEEVFPNYGYDPLEAQAAMAFLLLKNRVSVTATIAPSFDLKLQEGLSLQEGLPDDAVINPPIAFDFSHNGHRSTQALMWTRIYRIADGLISLLKSVELRDGVSFWDRTLIYVATDFGRSKNRPPDADEFGTAHDLNNGVLVISPLVQGNRVLGGVRRDNALTYGFDPQSGVPIEGRRTSEAELFSGLLHALGVNRSGSGLPSVTAFARA